MKFFWPGLIVALLMVAAWKCLRWKHWAVLFVVFIAGATVGDEDQSARLLYTTVFPLTRVDTPANAPYKKEIRDWVTLKRERIEFYQDEDDEVHDFLRSPSNEKNYPLWRKLEKEQGANGLNHLYHQLAFEAILSQPFQFFGIGLRRLVGSANLSDFKLDRFDSTYFADRFVEQLKNDRNSESMIRLAFGLPFKDPLPSTATFHAWLAPHPDSAAAKFLIAYTHAYEKCGDIIVRPPDDAPSLKDCRPSLIGWFLIAGILLSFIPPYWRTLGAWNVIIIGYLCAVYLVGIEHTRYFAPFWPFAILNLGLVAEGLLVLLPGLRPWGKPGKLA